MKIDWKYVASTPGYIKFKKAYIKDVQEINRTVQRNGRPMREKPKFYRHFKSLISRACHIANTNNEPIDEVLNRWAKSCDYWWLNFHGTPKKNSNSLLPWGKNQIVKYYGKQRNYNNNELTELITTGCRQRREHSGKKPRYTTSDKINHKRLVEYRKRNP